MLSARRSSLRMKARGRWLGVMLPLSFAVVAFPAWAQQGGMGSMGGSSSGSARQSVPPTGRPTIPAPGMSGGPMGGSRAMSNLPPATRPLGIAGLGVQSGMSSGMNGVPGLPGQSSMGSMTGSSASGMRGSSGMAERTGLPGGTRTTGMGSRSNPSDMRAVSPSSGMGASGAGMAGGSGLGGSGTAGRSMLTRPPAGGPSAGSSAGMSTMPGSR